MYILLLFIFLLACTDKKADNNKKNAAFYREIDVSRVYHEKNQNKLSDICEIKNIIPLEDNDASFIKEITKVFIDTNRMILFDKRLNKVFLYSDKGKYINRVDPTGYGPREFNRITDVDFDPNDHRLYLLDMDQRKVVVYDDNLVYVNYFILNTEAAALSILDKERMALYLDYSLGDEYNLQFVHHRQITGKFFYYPKIEYPVGFSSISGGIQKNEEGLLYSEPFINDIYQVFPDGHSLKYKITLPGTNIAREKKYDLLYLNDMLIHFKMSYLKNQFYENRDALILSFVQGHKIKTLIYDKRTHQSYVPGVNVQEDIIKGWQLTPKGVAGAYFIAVVWPYEYVKTQKFDMDNPFVKKMNTLVKNGQTNPVLILYALKNNT